MNKNREKLIELSKSAKYVFHGTNNGDIDIFEPRQAYNHNEDGQRYKDGNPAVFASDNIESSIFFAIMRSFFMRGSSFSVKMISGELKLGATKNRIEYLKKNDVFGYVYVFDKKDFFKRKERSSENVCEKKVKPVYKIKVSNKDIAVKVDKMKMI